MRAFQPDWKSDFAVGGTPDSGPRGNDSLSQETTLITATSGAYTNVCLGGMPVTGEWASRTI